jgi:hypothetical protein
MSISAANSLAAGDLSYRAGLTQGTSISAGNDAGKLWLPIWSGEVLHAYDEYRMFEPMVTSRMIDSGRTIEFPMTGTVALKEAWAAGEYLVGGDSSVTETFAISLDARPMAAHFELDNVDLMITQWEYRQELARQAGQTLANARDKQIASFITHAASAAKIAADPRPVSFPAPFQHADLADFDAEAALKVLEAIEDFCVDLQENDVPAGACYCAVSPRLFQQIRRLGVADTNATAQNSQPMFGGVAAAGGLGEGFRTGLNSLSDSLVYMGVTIVKTNHMPGDWTNATGTPVGESRYNIDGSAAGVKALLWCPDAVAAVRKTGLVVDTEDDIRRNTTFTVASMLSGTGVLKPELAKVVVDDTLTPAGAALLRSEVATAIGGDNGYAAS